MNKAEFTDLIKNPEKLGTEHIETLKNIVSVYPYFSTAHILLAKALFNTNHYEYEKQLKITALSVGNRAILYKFLNNQELEMEEENNFMKVPVELKVEKVSKPDFEFGKEEEEAILLEAKAILNYQDQENAIDEYKLDESNNEFSEKLIENTPIITVDNADLINLENKSIEPVENVTDIDFTKENEVKVNENVINNNEILVSDKNEIDFFEIDNNLNNDDIEPIKIQHIEIGNELENNTEDIAINEINYEKIEEKIAENFKSDNDYQLVDTEGSLVKFVNTEDFLPDFDESSLFVEDQEIETITKPVIPFELNTEETTSEIEIDKNLPEFDLNTSELKINEIHNEINNVFVNEASKADINLENLLAIDSENLTTDSDNLEKEGFIELDENLKHEIAFENEPQQIISNVENEMEVESSFDNEITKEVAIEEVSIDELNNHFIENAPQQIISNIENEMEVENELISLENSLLESNIFNEKTDELIDSNNIIEEVTNTSENFSFTDWLNKNNKNEPINLFSNPQEEIIDEEDEFVKNIKQILKVKSQTKLEHEINAEIENSFIHSKTDEAGSKIETNIVDEVKLVDEVNIVENNQIKLNEIVNETITSFNNESIESMIADLDNSVIKETVEKEVEIPIVNYEVKSILPDFEALAKEEFQSPYLKFDKKDGLIPNYEAPAFEPSFNFTYAEYTSLVNKEQKKEEIVKEAIVQSSDADDSETIFINAPLNELDFEKSFSDIYIPIKHNYKITSIKVDITETIIDEKKETIETNKLDVESILDKFLKENPSITRPKSEFFNPANVAKMSVEEKDEIVSETLAAIYLKQGLIKKAISTYEKLSLIYPHKITYFADLINQLKTEHHIN